MKTFKEFKFNTNETQIFESYEIEHLNEAETVEAERIYRDLTAYINENGIASVDEGILGTLVGGAAGFIIGPAIGKVIANALGIERGILYDMFTSRLVSAALGAAVGKNITK